MSSKGRTELQISLSRAKNVEEAAGDIRFYVFPQKKAKMPQNQFEKNEFFVRKFREVFHFFARFSEELRKNGRHQQLPRHFMLQIDLFGAQYDP